MATVARVIVLLWVDILAIYAMYVMMAYLTNVWELGFTHAAAIVNIFWGVVMLSPLPLAYIVDTIMGNYLMLLLSSVAYSVVKILNPFNQFVLSKLFSYHIKDLKMNKFVYIQGLGLLTMSTPPVLANAMGTCSDYKTECIGNGQKILFYTAMPLIAFGMAGHMTSWNSFMAEQLYEEQDDLDENTFWRFFYSILAVIIITFVAVLALPYIRPWSLRFGIPAICTLVATLLFLSGSCSYKYYRPQGSPLTMFVRVFVAAVSKLFYRTPKDVKELFEIQHPQVYVVPHTRSLRCLDKAAIVIPTKPLEEQEKNLWKLCSVTEVEETKTIIRMIPVWLTFILCGVVSAIGFTYFIEQLDHMNHKVGRLTVPTVALLWFFEQAQNLSVKLYAMFANSLGGSGSRKLAPSIGIAISMILAILCCITAAKVENRRLGVVQRHGLVDKPEETVPMTMFWMLPQFILLGAFNGIFNYSSICFFIDQSPVSTQRYLPFFINGVFGIGILGSVLSVYVVGKVSERGGKMNWFQHDLNGSRVDKYYWTLAWLMAVNLVIFIVVAIFYRYKESALGNNDGTEFGGIDEGYDDNAKALVWADIVGGYTMWIMVTYLTDVWNLNFTHAAAILNLSQGSATVLQFGFAFLVDAFLGHSPMLLISTISYSIGLGLLSMSTPPVTGTCKLYKPECIGNTQKILLYMALVQIAIGLSGHAVSLLPFFRFQVEENRPYNYYVYRQRYNSFEFAVGVSICIGPLTAAFLPLIAKERWSLVFGVPAIVYLVSTLLYLIGIRWYLPMEPEGSSLTKVLRVLTASTFKMFQKLPNQPSDLYEENDPHLSKMPHTPRLRFLDKAAILLPSESLQDVQDKGRWRLCTVTEVEETKIAIRIIPLAIAFIICGLVCSIGNTYFVEQANHMNRKVGKIKVPLFTLLIIFEFSKLLFTIPYIYLTYCLDNAQRKKYAPPIGIAMAMVFSTLCCVVAAKVEARRLNVIVNHGLLDKPQETVPMSVFWLVPQFFLLSGVSSFLENSVKSFLIDQIPPSMRNYLQYFSTGVYGLGTMASVLSVYVAGRVSGRGGKTSWFQDTLNKSRLDKYYWLLAAMSAANLVFYILVAIFYPYREAALVDEEEEETGNGVFPIFPVVYQ
ncbi:hypothetical protein BUALT_Bualt09G0123600 [Buddleja alternifolia]|uniref:Uncharacterized protein n=1 Tax=Buddleja alternifolia TaxID=168488 RepID=A0AAV6X223_9LAMI|nr:hypothetical protein BUALT_Bualt09G0123600 [Buddleja alternifolia]